MMRLPFVTRKAYDLLKKERREIDALFWFSGIAGPLATLPQIYTIYAHKSALGVSLLSWGLYTIMSVVGLAYGLLHRLNPLIVSYLLWVLVNGAVALGAILYV